MHRGCGTLFVKLIDAKVTYVHQRLWPALLRVASARAAWQRTGLSEGARALQREIQRRGAVRSDQLSVLPAARRTAAIQELEVRLLVHSVDVHTETRAHRKLLRTWSRWSADHGAAPSALPVLRAREELVRAAEPFHRAGDRALRFPWSSAERRTPRRRA
jgi:hypothetical protein